MNTQSTRISLHNLLEGGSLWQEIDFLPEVSSIPVPKAACMVAIELLSSHNLLPDDAALDIIRIFH